MRHSGYNHSIKNRDFMYTLKKIYSKITNFIKCVLKDLCFFSTVVLTFYVCYLIIISRYENLFHILAVICVFTMLNTLTHPN